MENPRVYIDFNADLDQPPVEKSIEFLKMATNHFTVAIYSTRFEAEGGIEQVKLYIMEHAVALGYDTNFIGDIEWLTEIPNEGILVGTPVPPAQLPEMMTSEKLFTAVSTEMCREFAGNVAIPMADILRVSTAITRKFFPDH